MAFQPFENLKVISARRLNPAGQGVRVAQTPMRKTLKYGGPLLGGLALYFYSLGKAAFTGFVVGATIGGSIGAVVGGYIGLQIAIATGPFAPIVGVVTVPVGAAAGGVIGASIGGVAGGLIALGMASGSTTLVSMGAGSGIGGLVGGYIGFTAGAATGTFLAAGCIAITVICTPFAPFIVASSTFTGMAIGATVGALVGGAIGYGFGKYVATPLTKAVKGAVSTIKGGAPGASTGVGSIPSGITSGISKVASGVSGAIQGTASAIWGGITGSIGSIIGFGATASNFLISGLGSLSIPTSLLTVPLSVGIGGVGIGTLFLTGFVAPAAFFTAEGESGTFSPSQNEFFAVTKTVTPNNLANLPSGQTQQVQFTVTITAKGTKLTNMQVTDTLNPSITPITITCPATLEPNTNCTQNFTVSINSSNNNSVVTNTVNVTATPEGQAPITGAASAFVTIGTPASNNCFTYQGNWTSSEQTLEAQAISALSRAPAYLNQVCSQGQVILRRENSDGYNYATCPNIITISNRGLGNADNTTYTLAHETGHIVQCYGMQSWSDFQNAAPWSEGYICSYPLAKTTFEDFAESIAIHVTWRTHVSNACGSINYPTTYPLHYNFTTTLFGGVQF